MFYLLSGTAEFRHAGPGDFVLLPAGLRHTFLVGADEPLRGSADHHAGRVRGLRSRRRRTRAPAAAPGPAPVDPAGLARAAARRGHELLGPPPQH
jgi:hypothetical protein